MRMRRKTQTEGNSKGIRRKTETEGYIVMEFEEKLKLHAIVREY